MKCICLESLFFLKDQKLQISRRSVLPSLWIVSKIADLVLLKYEVSADICFFLNSDFPITDSSNYFEKAFPPVLFCPDAVWLWQPEPYVN